MKENKSTYWKCIPIVLTALGIIATILYSFNLSSEFEWENLIFKSNYTLPSINFVALIGSIFIYCISRIQEGKNGSVISMLSLSLLSLSNLSIISDLMKMADDISVNQTFTLFMLISVCGSYLVVFILFLYMKYKVQPSDKKAK